MAGGAAAARGVERAIADRRRKAEDEVDRLLEAARVVMRRSGSVEPTVGEILAESGLSTGALYRHFPGKDDLLLALLEEAGATTLSFVEHRMAEAADPVGRIAAWVAAMCGLLRDDDLVERNRPFLLAHPRLLERFPAEINAMASRLTAPLTDAIAEADTRHRLDPTAEAALVYHQVFGLLIDHAAQQRPVTPTAADVVVAHVCRAVVPG